MKIIKTSIVMHVIKLLLQQNIQKGVNEGLKYFKCEFCGKSFSAVRSLQKHFLKIHESHRFR